MAKEDKVKLKIDRSNISLNEMKMELQKLTLDVTSGKEKNTSLLKTLKKEIARKLTIK